MFGILKGKLCLQYYLGWGQINLKILKESRGKKQNKGDGNNYFKK